VEIPIDLSNEVFFLVEHECRHDVAQVFLLCMAKHPCSVQFNKHGCPDIHVQFRPWMPDINATTMFSMHGNGNHPCSIQSFHRNVSVVTVSDIKCIHVMSQQRWFIDRVSTQLPTDVAGSQVT